jgi:GT2 family glycosyltransferase
MTPGRISVILPYWERPEAALAGLCSLSQHYRGEDVEVVLVDDGSTSHPAARFLAGASLGVAVKLVEMPLKQDPMCPCTPINRGVDESSGEFIFLSNPETTHRAPILQEMRRTIETLGPSTYVHAAAFCPDTGGWHTHSVYASAAYHFASMLRRDLFDKAGGFDEEYRQGNCFDDPDFVQRVLRAGGQFVFRDDLIVDHHKSGATIFWPREGWDRNHALFWSKWPDPRCIDGTPMTYERLNNWR